MTAGDWANTQASTSAWAETPSRRAMGASTGCVRQLAVQPAAADGAVGQEPDPLLRAVPHHSLRQRLPEERIQPVLHRGDRHDRLGRPDLGHAHVRQPHPADLARPAEVGERAHAVLERHGGVRRVQLVERDALDPECAQRPLAGGRGAARGGRRVSQRPPVRTTPPLVATTTWSRAGCSRERARDQPLVVARHPVRRGSRRRRCRSASRRRPARRGAPAERSASGGRSWMERCMPP